MYHGSYEIEIPENTNKEISFVCSLESNIEELNIKKTINKEIIRINELMYKSELIEKKSDLEKQSKEELEKRNLIRDFIMWN